MTVSGKNTHTHEDGQSEWLWKRIGDEIKDRSREVGRSYYDENAIMT